MPMEERDTAQSRSKSAEHRGRGPGAAARRRDRRPGRGRIARASTASWSARWSGSRTTVRRRWSRTAASPDSGAAGARHGRPPWASHRQRRRADVRGWRSVLGRSSSAALVRTRAERIAIEERDVRGRCRRQSACWSSRLKSWIVPLRQGEHHPDQGGKILLQGAYVSNQSSGVLRIKGGSVQIN